MTKALRRAQRRPAAVHSRAAFAPLAICADAFNGAPPAQNRFASVSKFQPDSFIVAEVRPSPNFDERQGGPPDMILLHYTGMKSGAAALERLCAADSKVSAHYLVFADGRIVQCVPEDKRAWHAGVSSWAGETDINSRSIGIEIVNPGHEFGYSDFPRRQVAAAISLCKSILSRHGRISPERVLAHSDVAPARKQDPGEKFPWGLLADSGIGHWVRPAPLTVEGPALHPGEHGEAVRRLQRALKSYGYGVEESGSYDEATRAVVTAFQRHFRPARVDGIADASTVLTLRALTETRPQSVG
jgi:N-acetylmuramoyl-L-alanine amidase